MDEGRNRSKVFLTLAAFLSLIFAAACAEIPLNLKNIPAPPACFFLVASR
jgi:hypothetical protein